MGVARFGSDQFGEARQLGADVGDRTAASPHAPAGRRPGTEYRRGADRDGTRGQCSCDCARRAGASDDARPCSDVHRRPTRPRARRCGVPRDNPVESDRPNDCSNQHWRTAGASEIVQRVRVSASHCWCRTSRAARHRIIDRARYRSRAHVCGQGIIHDHAWRRHRQRSGRHRGPAAC